MDCTHSSGRENVPNKFNLLELRKLLSEVWYWYVCLFPFFCCVCYIVYSFFLLWDTMLLLEVCQSVMRYLLSLLVGYICDFAMEGRIVVNLLTNSFPFEFICKATIGCILLLPLALIYGQKTGKDCLVSQGLGCNFLYHYYELRIPTNWLCCLFIYPLCQPLWYIIAEWQKDVVKLKILYL